MKHAKLRTLATFAVTAVFAVGIGALPSSAAVSSSGIYKYCEPDEGVSYSGDYAWIKDANDSCEYFSVRHLYQPKGVPYQFWTNSKGGSGNYYASPVFRELIKGEWLIPV